MTGDYTDTDVPENKVSFILDSGASDHIINREDLFNTFSDISTPLKISVAKSGQFISATKKGTINVTSNLGIQGTLEGVLFCAEAPYNLLSVQKMQRAGMTVIFNQQGAQIYKDGKVFMKGRPLHNLIALDFNVSAACTGSASHICSSNKNGYELWHQRLGHVSKIKFLDLKNKNMIDDVQQIDTIIPNDEICEACINGKQTRLPFNHEKDKHHIKRPLFVVHSDVCGLSLLQQSTIKIIL